MSRDAGENSGFLTYGPQGRILSLCEYLGTLARATNLELQYYSRANENRQFYISL